MSYLVAAKNWLINLIFIICVVIALSGCSAVGVATTYVVDEYCQNSQTTRLAVREVINLHAKPHYVRIDCNGDDPFLSGTSN